MTLPERPSLYPSVEDRSDLHTVFRLLREDVNHARSREQLHELYRRAGYLIDLSRSYSWEEKFGDDVGELRQLAEEEFAATARDINRQAKTIGTEANFDEHWIEL